jgi:hypothetical protein
MLSGATHTTFRDILAASAEWTLLTSGSPNGGGGTTLISVITPSLIFEELDIQRNNEPPQKKPLVTSPIGR